MELKPIYDRQTKEKRKLLIVPYGIETTVWIWLCHAPRILLIVPYGIETNSTSILSSFFNSF